MIFNLDLKKYKEYREQLKKIKNELLISGIDYNLKKKRITGMVEKDTRPELTKSGAEKIIQILNARVEYSIYKEIEDNLHYEVVLQADLYIEDKHYSRCWASYSTSEQSKKQENDLMLAKMSKKNNAYKLAQKRAMVQIALMASGMSEFFSSDLEEGNNKVELKQNIDNNLENITKNSLVELMKKATNLKELNEIVKKNIDNINKFNLQEFLTNKKRELWVNWSNKFSEDIEKCKNYNDLEVIKTKYIHLIQNQEFSTACKILIKQAEERIR